MLKWEKYKWSEAGGTDLVRGDVGCPSINLPVSLDLSRTGGAMQGSARGAVPGKWDAVC